MISTNDQPGGPESKPTRQQRKPSAPHTIQKHSIPVTIDSANHFEVVELNGGVAIKNGPGRYEIISKDQAVNLAAWLVAMSGASGDDLLRMLTEIAKK